MRRSADEAQTMILDAAEHCLLEGGPDSIRLQEIARAVGISHPAVLHHFGTRENLVEAVVKRAVAHLETDLVRLLSHSQATDGAAVFAAIEHVFAALVSRGHGRMLAWLLLSGNAPHEDLLSLHALAELAHRKRLEAAPAQEISFEDTCFRILLVAISVLGESVAGPALRESLGLDARDEAQRFRAWLVRMLAPPEFASPASKPAK